MKKSRKASSRSKSRVRAANRPEGSRKNTPTRPDGFASKRPFPIVGVGASAGGLEAFSELLKGLPADTGMAFVLVQHLAPARESELTHLLSRMTEMPTHEVTNNLRVEPNHVYVIPPNTHMTIAGGVLKLSKREAGSGSIRSIDFFFESLAQEQHEMAIGVILSGTATDGTLGLEAIKAEGGITFAQDETAKYDSMPRNAVASGCVDLTLSPKGIAKELAEIAQHPYVAGRGLLSASDAKPKPAGKEPYEGEGLRPIEERFKAILLLLRRHAGVDFSLYKTSTIHRRITRRMVLNRLTSLTDYARFLKSNPKELAALHSDLLINVTSFFRNPEAFELLKRRVVPKLFGHPSDEAIRVWVLGCSTGQEAYSLGMILEEAMNNLPRKPKLQIFATDLNEALLDRARAGLYAKSVVQGVSPDRLRRFFTEEEGGYRISKALRDVVVFAKQNLISDPPFSRMDLISCRNVMIYLESNLQKRLIPTLHYALKPSGFLFVGASESIGGYQELFELIDKKHKIYAKKPGATPVVNLHFMPQRSAEKKEISGPKKQTSAPEKIQGELNVQREADRVALNRYVPPSVLVNAELNVVHFRGDTSPYLKPPTGKPRFHLLHMAREGLVLPLRTALNKAKHDNRTARRENIKVQQNGQTRTANIEIIPLRNLKERCFLIFFEDCDLAAEGAILPRSREAALAETQKGPAKEMRQRMNALERDLAETRDYLQSVQEQYEAANEELQASNEEVTSANEELQSINEELETSKEELESTNEELTTVNEEMANRNVELGRLNSDLNNLYANINMAIVVLGRDLSIRRFTAPAEKIFNLLATDVGQPITRVRNNLESIDLGALLSEVIDTVSARECEARAADGRWYAVRARPYLSLENKIDGAVLVVMDIDAIKRSEQESKSAREYSDTILRMAPVSLVVLGPDLSVDLANEAFYRTFKTSPEETVGRKIYKLGNGQWRIPKLRHFLEEIIPRNSYFSDFEVVHEFPIIGRRTMSLSGRRLEAEAGRKSSILLSIEDLTRRLDAEAAVRRSETRFRRLFETARDGVLIVDSIGRKITDSNPFASELLGQSRAELLGKELWQIGLIQDEPASHRVFRGLQKEGVIWIKDIPLTTGAGEERIVDLIANRYLEDGREVIQCNIRDITERKHVEVELSKAKEQLERANATLEERVRERTEALQELNGRLRELSGRLVNAQEEERARIARELHDEVGQALTAAKLVIRQIKDRPSAAMVEELEALISDLMGRVRRLSMDLHPHVLDDLGLKAALDWHFRAFEALTRVKARFDYTEIPARALNPQIEITLFRIVQEALTNVARHAGVSEAVVRLFPERNAIHLEIHDAGSGFDAERRSGNPTSGLSGMEERVLLAGGTFRVDSKPGDGTSIFVTVPFGGGGGEPRE